MKDIVVFGGGIIPEADVTELEAMGVRKIFGPGTSMRAIVDWAKENIGQKV